MNNAIISEGAVKDLEALVRASTIDTEHTDVPFVVIPSGHKLEDLERLQARPRRVREVVTLTTVESFIDYMKVWKQPTTSVIFANENMRSLRATIDYHEADDPTWCDHRAIYQAQHSRELKAWLENSGKAMQQIAFAEFIEDRIADVVDPQGADLLERVLKLQFITKGVFGSAVRLQSGEFSLQYSEEQEKGSVEFPEKLALGIPLFHNGKAYKVDVRLRYRLAEGKVTFTYKLVDIDRLIEHAFAEIVQKVAAAVTEVAIYQGSRAKD